MDADMQDHGNSEDEDDESDEGSPPPPYQEEEQDESQGSFQLQPDEAEVDSQGHHRKEVDGQGRKELARECTHPNSRFLFPFSDVCFLVSIPMFLFSALSSARSLGKCKSMEEDEPQSQSLSPTPSSSSPPPKRTRSSNGNKGVSDSYLGTYPHKLKQSLTVSRTSLKVMGGSHSRLGS